MKSAFVFFVAALLAIPSMTASAITIDGTADAQYGSAIVTQQLGTTAQDNNLTSPKGGSNGSELDAAYGLISNGVVYLVFAGNIDATNLTTKASYDKLSIFFMTGPGGQNVLTNGSYGGADFGNLNHMVGLKFDPGFAPNYWLSVPVGNTVTNPTAYFNFARLSTTNNTGVGTYLGASSPPNYIPLTNTTVSGASVISPFIAAIDNSNTNGVAGDPAGCETNGAPFGPASVKTGVELQIPVSMIGLTTGNVAICAFLTDEAYTNVYNQVAGPITGNSSYCQPSLGQSSNVNFGAFPGQHYFVIAAPPCTFGINPTSGTFGLNGGTGSFSIVVAGLCPWALTSNVPWVTITSPTSGAGTGTVSFSVGTNTTPFGRQGILTLLNPPSPPLTFAVNQFGQPLGPIAIDGTAECSNYGPPLVIQQIGTGFGDSTTGVVDFANGSELDDAYGIIDNDVLYLTFTGNLENNFNKLELFFQTGPGGQSTLSTNNPDVDFNGLNRMGTNGNGATNGTPGLTFDTGFAANYWISVACGGSPAAVFANYAQLWPGGTNSSGVATNGYFLGSTGTTTNGTLFGGTNPFGVQAAINNINIAGVDGSTCYNDPTIFNQGSVTTGVEIGIPLGAIGSPTGAVKVCAFINGTAHDFVSDQSMGPIWDGTSIFCQPNPGEPSAVNFSALPVNGQHFFVVGPQMRVTSISTVATNAVLSYLTAANANLAYQVQRNSAVTNAGWQNVGAPANGTGGIITLTIINGATNNPALFYRVRQTPICP